MCSFGKHAIVELLKEFIKKNHIISILAIAGFFISLISLLNDSFQYIKNLIFSLAIFVLILLFIKFIKFYIFYLGIDYTPKYWHDFKDSDQSIPEESLSIGDGFSSKYEIKLELEKSVVNKLEKSVYYTLILKKPNFIDISYFSNNNHKQYYNTIDKENEFFLERKFSGNENKLFFEFEIDSNYRLNNEYEKGFATLDVFFSYSKIEKCTEKNRYHLGTENINFKTMK